MLTLEIVTEKLLNNEERWGVVERVVREIVAKKYVKVMGEGSSKNQCEVERGGRKTK